MFGCHRKYHFPENDFWLTNIFTFDPEIIFSPHFHFKSLPEKGRERERERERRESPDQREREPRLRRSSDERTRRTRTARRSRRSSIDERCDCLTIAIVHRAARRRGAIVNRVARRRGAIWALFL